MQGSVQTLGESADSGASLKWHEAAAATHHETAIRELVEELHLSPPLVETLYRRELERLQPARIDQYLSLITTRRVRELLRRNSVEPNA